MDGRQIATNEGGRLQVLDAAKFPRYGPAIPADPAQALAFFRQAAIALHERKLKAEAAIHKNASLLEARRRAESATLTSRQVNEVVFHEIGQTLLVEPLPASTQATLYRALARIPGITVRHGVKDLTGRPGVAFAMTNGSSSTSSQIILDARTYRYLGWQTVADTDLPPQPLKLPPGKRAEDGKGPTGFPGAKAGTVLDAGVTLVKSVVDRPGQRG